MTALNVTKDIYEKSQLERLTMISVIIAAFNAAATIDRCINSIDVAKKNHDIELIVIDDGSKDHTASLLHSWASARSWITVKSQKMQAWQRLVILGSISQPAITSFL